MINHNIIKYEIKSSRYTFCRNPKHLLGTCVIYFWLKYGRSGRCFNTQNTLSGYTSDLTLLLKLSNFIQLRPDSYAYIVNVNTPYMYIYINRYKYVSAKNVVAEEKRVDSKTDANDCERIAVRTPENTPAAHKEKTVFRGRQNMTLKAEGKDDKKIHPTFPSDVGWLGLLNMHERLPMYSSPPNAHPPMTSPHLLP